MTRQKILTVARPILFNAEMVRAVLDNRKTVTRRVVKFPTDISAAKAESVCLSSVRDIPCWNFTLDGSIYHGFIKPLANIGDCLYVRETWNETTHGYNYKASPLGNSRDRYPWKASIHMPKEAARLFLRVTDVRVERLQDITAEQAKAEGADCHIPVQSEDGKRAWGLVSSRGKFISLWDSTIKKSDLPLYGWEASPWVWVIEFERVEASE